MSEDKPYQYYSVHTRDIAAAVASLIRAAQDGEVREAELSYFQNDCEVKIKVRF